MLNAFFRFTDLCEMLKLRADDADAAAELVKLRRHEKHDRLPSPPSQSVNDSETWETGPYGSSSSSSSAAAPSPTTSTSKLKAISAKTNIATSVPEELPFELHEADFTRIKIGSIKRTWRALDTHDEETFSYPVWDSHDVSLA